MCSLGAKLAKLILFLVNITVWICGAVFLGVGIALAVDEDAWSWFEIAGGMDDDLFAAAVYIMISVGALLFVVGFFGCCGVWKGNTCMLQMYIIFMVILLILELVGVILAIVFKDSLEAEAKEQMYKDIQEKYDGVNVTDDGVSLAWNTLQEQRQCCGADNYTDYEGSNWATGKTDLVPITCCKGAVNNKDNYYSISAGDKTQCMAEAAQTNPTNTEQLFTQGCYDALLDWIDEQSAIIIGVLAGLGALQLFGLIGACCIKSSLENEVA